MKYHKNKKNLNWSNKTWGIHRPFWTWFLFLPSTLCYKSSTRFPKSIRSVSTNSASFFALSLWPLSGISWSTQFHKIYNGSDSLPDFLSSSLVYSIFSLCVKLKTFSQLESLYLCTGIIVSFKGGSSPFLWKFLPFLFSRKKI